MRLRLLVLVSLGLASLGLAWLCTARGTQPVADRRADGPARLCLLESCVRVGRLGVGETRVIELPWARAGAGVLRVHGVRTGCGCAAVEVPDKQLEPGTRGALRLRLHAARRRGPFVHHVRVYTDARPPHAVAVCRVVGHVEAAFGLVPAALDLGRRSAGTRIERVVELRAAEPLPSGLTFTWAGLAGRVVVEPAARPELPGAVLRLVLPVPRGPGPFRGRLVVHAGSDDLAVLPIRGVVEE